MSHKIATNSPDASTNVGKLDLGYENLAGDGTVSIKDGREVISKATAAAITLPPPTAGLPTAGGDDGKELTIVSSTAAAHVITCSQGFNGKGSSGTATFAASKGSSVTLVAFNGQWYVSANVGATLA